jgi:hypothetical protein
MKLTRTMIPTITATYAMASLGTWSHIHADISFADGASLPF